MIEWFLENIEWIFSGIGCLALSFILGRKSVQWNISFNDKSQKIIKGTGINNRTAETYHEDHSTHIENKKIIIRQSNSIDYNNFLSLTLGRSGCLYTMPTEGVFFVKGLKGSISINGKITESLLPEGKKVNVERKDEIKLVYENLKNIQEVELKFYYYKDSSDD